MDINFDNSITHVWQMHKFIRFMKTNINSVFSHYILSDNYNIVKKISNILS